MLNLRTRTILATGLTLAVLLAVVAGLATDLMLVRFRGIETDFMLLNVERLRGAVAAELKRLDSIATDWAYWDETCAFVEGSDPGYVERNLNDLSVANLVLNLLLYVSPSGRTAYSTGFDRKEEHKVPLPGDVETRLLGLPSLARRTNLASGRTGIIKLADGGLLAASRPIITSEWQGPIRGALIVGRYLDDELIGQFVETVQREVRLLPADAVAETPGLEAVRAKLDEAPEGVVMPLGPDEIVGCGMLRDVEGRPAFIAAVYAPRPIMRSGLATVRWMLLGVLATGLAFSGLILFMLDRVILRRISRLTAGVDRIRGQVVQSARVPVEGADELGRLARGLNTMLESIERAHSERIAVERKLKEGEVRYRQLFENIRDAIFVHEVGPDGQIGRFTLVNDVACERLGYTREELCALSPADIDDPEAGAAGRPAAIGELLARGEALFEMVHVAKDGRRMPVEIHARMATLGGKNICLSVVRDLTERRRAEEERRKLEMQIQHTQKLESLGVLAGGIAHDFNNLLMTMLGNVDLALDDLSPVSPARENLRDVERAARRAAELCRQMLAYSGRGKFVIQPLNLNDLVREMTHMLEVSISKKAVLRYNLTEQLPATDGDATQIRQVIMNLVVNASEAIGDRSGVISLSTGAMQCDAEYLRSTWLREEAPGGLYVTLEVSDTGCGIDRETLPRIFDPFFTTKFAGRGLGLAAVLGIVRGHRGAIKVYSEPGRGTTFKVLLPASAREAVRPEKQGETEPAWRGTGTVLLVDDEESVRALAARMLSRLGFTALTAADGREAVRTFRERAGDIACVIMDLTMPHMDGEEAFRELRRIRSDIPVLLSSGYNEQEAVQRFIGKGLAGFIQKPYTRDVLAAKLREIFEHPPAPPVEG